MRKFSAIAGSALFLVAAPGVVAGFVVLALPSESALALTRLVGLWLLLLGLAELGVAFAWWSALRRERAGSRPGASSPAG